MNASFKSLLWLIAASAVFLFGLRHQKEKELDTAQQEYTGQLARATEVSRELSLLKEKIQNARGEIGSTGDFEARHNASLANIAAQQKSIESLLTQWPAVEADRAAAVQAVREKEATRPPVDVILADGTKLEKFVVRKVPDEETVAVEHSSGVVKLSADKLPADLKERLALGWKPSAPATVSMDKEGNAIVRQAENKALKEQAAADTAKELNIAEKDSTSIGGITRALAITEAQLEKAEKSFEDERSNIRRLSIFKSDARDGSGKSYASLKKEANARLTSLAGRIQVLRAERSNLQYKLKSL